MFSQKEKTVIYDAFDMYYAEYCNAFPSNEELGHITFTKEFEQRMQKLIDREQKFYFYWINTVGKRVAMIALVLLVCLTTVTFSVKALREPFLSFIVETYERFTNIIFVKDENEAQVNFEKIIPDYIPEGYSVTDIKADSTIFYEILYSGEDENSYILYSQNTNGAGVQINTENVGYEELNINNNLAFYYSNKGINTIIVDGKNYFFTIEGTVTKEEIIKIAESIDEINFEIKLPNYIPEGYVKDIENSHDTLYQVKYNSSDGLNSIIFLQGIKDGTSVQANTEDVEYEKIYINACEGLIWSNNGYNSVAFNTDKYVFTVVTTLSREELIKIAESIDVDKPDIKLPNYIPEGYVKGEEYGSDDYYQVGYNTVDNSNIIIFSQTVNTGATAQANTQGVDYEKIYINKCEGLFWSNKGYNSVIFSTDKYIFTVETTLPREELIKIAESINICDFKVKKPNYIPEGYTLDSESNSTVNYEAIYYGADELNTIAYLQRITDGTTVHANTQGVGYEKIYINYCEGIAWSNKGNNSLVFSTDECVFMITTTLPKEELIKIAESIDVR